MATVLGELPPVAGGETIHLTKERLLIGSHRLCDVIIRSHHVAPVQCELRCERSPMHGQWIVRNLADNPTKVNAVAVGEERLQPGDILWVGPKQRYELCYNPEDLSQGENKNQSATATAQAAVKKTMFDESS